MQIEAYNAVNIAIIAHKDNLTNGEYTRTKTLYAYPPDVEPEWSKVNTTGAETLVAPLALAEMTATLTIATGSAAYPHYVVSFGNLPVNTYEIGDLIGFKVSRRTGQGTYTADIIIEKVALHVPTDTNGSRQIYVK